VLRQQPTPNLAKNPHTFSNAAFGRRGAPLAEWLPDGTNHADCSGRTRSMTRPKVHLTPRERDVVRHVIAGRKNRDIAKELGLTEQTIKNVLSVTYGKCHVRNRLQLMLYAMRHDILSR
jgi:DNA-binding NarL/FixJ family response regulator